MYYNGVFRLTNVAWIQELRTMTRGAIILCGGRSQRIGIDKALLPFGNETLLERVVRQVGYAVEPQHTVVVAAAEQQLPPLPSELHILRDQKPFEGPLIALATGLAALEGKATAAFATGCDTPWLLPKVIGRLFSELEDFQAAVPQDSRRMYPLSAVYRMDVKICVKQAIAAGRRSLHELLNHISAKRIPLEDFQMLDPGLVSFVNVNSQADYEAALAQENMED